MIHFLTALINPVAVLMLFVLLYAFSVHAWAGYTNRAQGVHVWPVLWFILGIVALIAWLFLVF